MTERINFVSDHLLSPSGLCLITIDTFQIDLQGYYITSVPVLFQTSNYFICKRMQTTGRSRGFIIMTQQSSYDFPSALVSSFSFFLKGKGKISRGPFFSFLSFKENKFKTAQRQGDKKGEEMKVSNKTKLVSE